MYWDIVDAKIAADNAVSLEFRDGTTGTIKFSDDFFKGVFGHLRDPAQFRQLRVTDGTLSWPGSLDLAPDGLYQAIKHTSQSPAII